MHGRFAPQPFPDDNERRDPPLKSSLIQSGLCICAATLLSLVMIADTNASISLVATVGGQPNSSANYVTFDSGTNTGTQWSNTLNDDFVTVNLQTDAAFVTGSSSGVYAAPYLSGNNGLNFGLGNATGPTTTQYLTSGSTNANAGAEIEILFNTDQMYFGLLWGSVDNYNTLSFYDGNTLVGTINGGQVNPGATGDQGINGTYYVNLNSDTAFDRVVITSTKYAFELDNIAYSRDQFFVVPEPASLLVWSMLVGACSLTRRRRS